MKRRICELCDSEAFFYCGADSAFLCINCDARVHQANFLVARHVREVLCFNCRCFAGIQISGTVAPPTTSACRSCSPEEEISGDEDDSLSSSMSACVSTTESWTATTTTTKIRQAEVDDDRRWAEMVASSSSVTDENGRSTATTGRRKKNTRSCTAATKAAEEVLVSWSRRFGVKNVNRVASLASPAVGKLMTVVPFRVAVATSFWFALRYIGEGSFRNFQNLKRLEEISKVPGKVVVAAEEKLARALRPKRETHVRELEEGWAEC